MGEELGPTGLVERPKNTYSRSGRTGECGRSGPSGSSENLTEFDTCIWSVYEMYSKPCIAAGDPQILQPKGRTARINKVTRLLLCVEKPR